MEECIFCKIVKGEIPSYKIYEDDFVLAFLDIHPTAKGHTLVIPKAHFMDIFDMDDEITGTILDVAKKVSIELRQTLHADGVNLLNASGEAAQQSVFHFHLHVVPRFENDGMNLWFHNYANENINLEEVYTQITGSHLNPGYQ